MKVLTTQEPYATLIKDGYKKIETRSWKTNYRGELYIHASKGKKFLNSITDIEVLKIIKELTLNYGKIICKANLVDCVLMDEEFIKRVKSDNQLEYSLGIYELGRYAWILEDVEILTDFISASGKLNIWNFESENSKIKVKSND